MDAKIKKNSMAGLIKDVVVGDYALRGSSTIEASLIMPIILTIIFLLLYLTQFMYVKAQFSRTAYVAALRASRAEDETTRDRINIANEEFNQLLTENYTGSSNYTKEITEKNEMMYIKVQVGQNLPQSIFMTNGFMKGGFVHETTYKAKVCHPIELIRKCRKLEKNINIENGGFDSSGNQVQTGSE